MIGPLEAFATPVVTWLSRLCWDATLSILIVWLVLQIVRRFKPPAWFKHWCWRLVFVKLLLACVIWQPLEVPVLPAVPSSSSMITITPPVYLDRAEVEVSAASMTRVGQPAVSVPVTVAPATAPRISWQAGFALLWLVGVIASAGVLAWQFLQVCRLPLQPITDAELLNRCQALSAKVGVRPPPMMTCSRLRSPSLVGFLRTSIVFPPQTIAQCGSSEMDAILYHEMAHLRRRDLWWNLLPAVVQVLLFFHPLVWLARSRWQLTREQACDAQAIEHLDDSVSVYARSLLRIAELISNRVKSERLIGCVSVFHSASALEQRLVAMKSYERSSWKKSWVLASCLAVLGTVATIPWTPVNRAAAATNLAEEDDAESESGRNLDFEEKTKAGYPDDWTGGSEHFAISLDTEQPFRGQSCARIKGDGEGTFGTILQSFNAKPFRGKRIEYTGHMRTDLDDDSGTGQLWMRVDADVTPVAFDNMQRRPVKGKTAWKQYSIVLDVPAEATNITFGALMHGSGSVWIDAIEIKVAANDAKVTGLDVMRPAESLANGDFEQPREGDRSMPAQWGGGGKGYELIRDTYIKHSGLASARISQLEATGGFGTFTAGLNPRQYLGKRVRFSGYMKTEDVQAAGLWMRVDGDKRAVLAFDNMQKRPVSGTTDWKEYEVVLDVPDSAININLGFLSIGKGIVWADDLKLEVASDAESTDMNLPSNISQIPKPDDFYNGNFEDAAPTSLGLMHWGGGGIGYKATRDETVKYSGTASARISRQDDSGKFGSFTQYFPATKYVGKRIRFRGYLKTEDADSAGLWMRVDGPLSGRIVRGNPLKKVLGYDGMKDRPVTGTSDWESHEVILDVPPNATTIFVGFRLSGDGKVWGDEFTFQVVGEMGQGPATTNLKETRRGR